MPCGNCGGCARRNPGPLSETEQVLLDELAQNAFLPVARFLLRSRENPEMAYVMSAPVYLPEGTESVEQIRQLGTALLSLQKRGYLTLDYGEPLGGFDYGAWKDAEFYRSFAFSVDSETVQPVLEPGSAALTLQGQEAADELNL